MLLLSGKFFFRFSEARKLNVPPGVTGSLGDNVTLPCQIQSQEETKITQIHIIVFNIQYGISIHESPLKGRVNISEQSLTITDVEKTDEGLYTCSIVSFPGGALEGTTKLTVVVPLPHFLTIKGRWWKEKMLKKEEFALSMENQLDSNMTRSPFSICKNKNHEKLKNIYC
uniref:Ig-like domain-containing protein n=1 Tax=Kryptolebias marmoratus TaxID=37003 RepID=A0A3Q3AQC2_KRYMA